MTPTQLSSAAADSAATSNTGKMILGDTWYFAAVLSEDLVLTVRDAAPTELSPEVLPAASEGSGETKGQAVNTDCVKLVIEATGKEAHTISVAFLPLADGEAAPEALPALKKLALW
jgi:hypothetical protein